MMHVQMKSTPVISKPWLSWVVVLAVSTLAACSSTSDKPAPTALTPLAVQRSVAPIWSAQVGTMGTTLSMNTTPGRLALVSQNGLVSVINAENGSLAWQLPLIIDH